MGLEQAVMPILRDIKKSFLRVKQGKICIFVARRTAFSLTLQSEAFAAQGIPFWVESFTNQQFVILTDAQKETLEKRYIFEPMGKSADGGNIARFCTSWATTEAEKEQLIGAIRAL